jgi:hypothetical protein
MFLHVTPSNDDILKKKRVLYSKENKEWGQKNSMVSTLENLEGNAFRGR